MVLLVATWEALGRSCSEQTIEQALSFAEARARAIDPEAAVLVHGDAHSDNTLQNPVDVAAGESGFKFVDPDGFRAVPTISLSSCEAAATNCWQVTHCA